MPTNKNLAAFNQRTSGMPLWEKYAFMNLMLADLAGQVDGQIFEDSMDAACKFGIGSKSVGPKLVEKTNVASA